MVDDFRRAPDGSASLDDTAGIMCRVTAPPHRATDRAPLGGKPAEHAVTDRPTTRAVPRRSVLRGGVAVGVGTVAVLAATTACDRGPTPAQTTAEALLPLARAADAEAASARALAPRVAEYAAALGVVADQRAQHARALREEITRLNRDIATRIDAGASSGVPSPGGGSAPAPGGSAPAPAGSTAVDSVPGLRTALTASARAARDTAIRLQGYSAGLAGSVSASTTTLTEVQLA
ncbi:hypothetical protein GCM10009624_09190 [Gordonia sinesedis]